MADIDALKRALVNADRAGDVEAARTLARALKARMSAPVASEEAPMNIDQRIAGAFEDASRQPEIVRGNILPLSRVGDDVRFDSDAGLLGVAKRAFMLPGQVYKGEVQLTGPDGRVTPEAIDRVTELASFAPAGMAARLMQARGAIRPPVQQIARRNVDEAAEFGIDLSRGQASRETPVQAFEQDALTGGRGTSAQQAIAAQREMQAEQVRKAAEAMQDRVYRSPDGDVGFLNSQDRIYGAAENIGRAVFDEATRRKNLAQSSYKSAETLGGEISPEATGTLANTMRGILDEAGAMEGTAIGADLPAVARVMRQIDSLSSMKNAPEGNVTGVSWQNFERIRKQITAQANGSDNQARVFGAMKRGLDDWLEKTIDDGLVAGSPDFIKSLKSARGQWADYMRIKKNPQQIIRKMADEGANSVEIANWIYGANKVGGRSQSADVVSEIKSLIGSDSPAFMDLRRNVLTRLFNDVRQGDVKTYGRLAGDINDFVNGRGRELARALYDDAQIKELNRFASVLRNLTPDDVATNPSRSGQTIARRFNEIADKLGGLLGFASTQSFTGLLAGLAVGKVANIRSGIRARSYAQQPIVSDLMRIAPLPTNATARATAGLAPGVAPLEIETSSRQARRPY